MIIIPVSRFQLNNKSGHTEDSRFDIVVEISTGLRTDVIFIGSKIGAKDGSDALKQYAEILSNLPRSCRITSGSSTCV
ncbi:hypothetical protein [Nostoc punctiforme]|uniref:hypothetical protein n=1 Tax=Nostoc punctiforme TaxID=272131 RepID=UPI000045BFA7|nr:hypothetical protein [Nostoc punctiforme]